MTSVNGNGLDRSTMMVANVDFRESTVMDSVIEAARQ